MSETLNCQICGASKRVRTMQAACSGDLDRSLAVCESCLDRRAAKRWDASGREGRRLVDALASRRHEHPQGRYSYLVEPGEEVSLVRLQHGWLQANAARA